MCFRRRKMYRPRPFSSVFAPFLPKVNPLTPLQYVLGFYILYSGKKCTIARILMMGQGLAKMAKLGRGAPNGIILACGTRMGLGCNFHANSWDSFCVWKSYTATFMPKSAQQFSCQRGGTPFAVRPGFSGQKFQITPFWSQYFLKLMFVAPEWGRGLPAGPIGPGICLRHSVAHSHPERIRARKRHRNCRLKMGTEFEA